MRRAPLVRAALVSLLFVGVALAAPDAPPPDDTTNNPTDSTMSGGALPFLPEAEAPAVARDVGIAELPLLVTEPPEEEAPADIPAPIIGGADSTLNPFSPLLLPQPEGATEPAQPAAAPPAQTERPVQEGAPTASPTPPATPEVADVTPAPVPAARTGTSAISEAVTARLQPPLPRSTLSASLLENTLGASGTSVTTLGPASGRAAIRVPPSLTLLGVAPTVASSTPPPGLAPLGFAGNEGNITSTASNPVGRSLRELRVDFTAMATGTGIFRVGDSAMPVLVRVGEPLPGTELVLSRLTSGSAQFSAADVRHTLSLNP